MSEMLAAEKPAMKPAKRKLKLAEPHAYLIIFAILVIALIGTWFVPAGEYNRVLDPATKRMIA
ncbi:MAG: YfcC family protein, partial [Deltaproteobacteria bacterium]|nr:YfcC family protein [Deltaproteobacteria bacterium]